MSTNNLDWIKQDLLQDLYKKLEDLEEINAYLIENDLPLSVYLEKDYCPERDMKCCGDCLKCFKQKVEVLI